MKTTIEIPDSLFHRAKVASVQRGTTLKRLVIDGLEKELAGPLPPNPIEFLDLVKGGEIGYKGAVMTFEKIEGDIISGYIELVDGPQVVMATLQGQGPTVIIEFSATGNPVPVTKESDRLFSLAADSALQGVVGVGEIVGVKGAQLECKPAIGKATDFDGTSVQSETIVAISFPNYTKATQLTLPKSNMGVNKFVLKLDSDLEG